jgi:hypothetical protein
MKSLLKRPINPASPAGRRLRLAAVTRRALVRYDEAARDYQDLVTTPEGKCGAHSAECVPRNSRSAPGTRGRQLQAAAGRALHLLCRYERLEAALALESGLETDAVYLALSDAWPLVFRLLDAAA